MKNLDFEVDYFSDSCEWKQKISTECRFQYEDDNRTQFSNKLDL